MSAPALVPLMCIQCQSPIPAKPDEVAWVCATCGRGQILEDEAGLQPLEEFLERLAALDRRIGALNPLVVLGRST